MLAEILHKVAGMERKETAYRPRPSSAGPDLCVRKLTYHAQEVTGRPIGDRFVMVMDDSAWHEELSADWIGKTAYTLHSRQMPITLTGVLPFMAGHRPYRCGECSKQQGRDVSIDPIDLHGHIDGILADLMLTDYLWEHKALNHFGFQRLWDGADPMDYFCQTGIYVRGVQVVQPQCRKTCLLVKNKNTSAYLEYLLDYDSATDTLTVEEVTTSAGEKKSPGTQYVGLYQQALDKFAVIEAHRRARMLPPRPYTKDSFHCDPLYCPYTETCWADWEAALQTDAAVALDAETVAAARQYLVVNRMRLDAEKQEKALKQQLKLALQTNNARIGRGDGVLIQIDPSPRRTVDESLIPPDILAQATVPTTVEKLSVKTVAAKNQTDKTDASSSEQEAA